MGELLSRAWVFVLPGLLPILALLHMPLVGRRGRTAWAIALGVVAIAFLVDLLIFDHSGTHTLQVKTFFGRGDPPEPHPFVVDEVMAPAWHWHVAASIWFAAIAAYAWLVRGRAPQPPRPVVISVAAFTWALVGRLALEKTAAPEEIVWAVGVSTASFAIALFFGWYCGMRGFGFGRFAAALLLANVLQRLVVVAVAYFATTRALGTHLDTHTITEIAVPMVGTMRFTDATDAWVRTALVPQLTFALLMTFVVGIVLGVLPWRLARRRAKKT